MVTLTDVMAARTRISDLNLRTPVLTDPTNTDLLLKAEHLQRTGSFKLRGASNRVLKAAVAGARHVVTASSGNHGQAVAYVAQRLGLRATIVAPENAPAVKVRGMRAWGAQVEFAGLTSPERFARAAEIVTTEGAVFIPPFDDPDVIAGQGTIGLELLEQVPDLEVVYAPVGGGGLLSGIATAIKESRPEVRVIGVEPELACDTYRSLQEGRIVPMDSSRTIADGLRLSQPGALPFSIIQQRVDEIVLVSEEEIRHTCRYLLTHTRQAVEPSAAVSVAAALRAGGRAVAVLSGGNIDLDALHGVPAWELA